MNLYLLYKDFDGTLYENFCYIGFRSNGTLLHSPYLNAEIMHLNKAIITVKK